MFLLITETWRSLCSLEGLDELSSFKLVKDTGENKKSLGRVDRLY